MRLNCKPGSGHFLTDMRNSCPAKVDYDELSPMWTNDGS